MTYEVKAEKLIRRSASDVFNALKGGLLFMNCGADSGSMQIDFRAGGKYQIDFRNKTLVNFGEFLEIIPNKKIVFSWCQTFGPDQKPDTQVVIELFAEGPHTRLTLSHTGFKDQATKDAHQTGWFGGLADFIGQVENGQLRMLRSYPVSEQRIFEACKNPESFFGLMGDVSRGSVDFKVGGKFQLPTATGEIKGEFLEIVPGKKIKLSWLVGSSGPLEDSHVVLAINGKEDGSSYLEIIHNGLNSFEEQKAHRRGWETVTKKMTEVL
ncbi:hypothetical protein DOM22_18850 [Bdellovibrio sp. ZAP7]|uniref:SRPBCC family protein n=1 Tax=Bdellovibrio sp. ZAP7 TaxID=2231053 RepID=UPI00115819BB|nr:SRPBCC domain-containing protein [Bdellovibrio sp. ZAP7]QDK47073.1 hypothetical protein DOM22_18850 [Bdellovibrio sp. ZAP7]